MKRLGKVLKAYRISKGFDLPMLKEKVGISLPKLQAFERGDQKPSENELKRLSEYWQVPMSVLHTLLLDVSKLPKDKRRIIAGMQDAMVDAAQRYLPQPAA